MTDCRHDLTPESCAICKGTTRRTVEDSPDAIARARWDARCDWCDRPIREGDRIGKTGGVWIHLEHFDQ